MSVRDGVNGFHLATNERWDVIILERMLPGASCLPLRFG
jgi:DNA-binding response OmpR family regulator